MITLFALALIPSLFSFDVKFDEDYDEFEYSEMDELDMFEMDDDSILTLEDLDEATKCEICVDLVTSAENFVQTYGGKYLKDFIRNKACTKVPSALQNACAEIGEKVIEVALRELMKLLDASKVCKKIKMC
ncbi:hypothetical protein BLNAU_24020 [Blattamonas nauphoetae]|uniref:Saposin B-type domain-containing protein n=1 Tax=Blattamonas nauphoetae TaxID=2049346 RepID=A0ABQ9WP22_9EUKA|nr:hypothetical protein BLNAU_24020 [Blattamonas nauphoetae]